MDSNGKPILAAILVAFVVMACWVFASDSDLVGLTFHYRGGHDVTYGRTK